MNLSTRSSGGITIEKHQMKPDLILKKARIRIRAGPRHKERTLKRKRLKLSKVIVMMGGGKRISMEIPPVLMKKHRLARLL